MPAYLFVDLELHDPQAYEAYKQQVPALVARHGGVYLARGGATEVIEGDWQPNRLVLFRFPDRAAIHRFMDDPDYAPLKALRQSVAHTRAIAFDGLDEPLAPQAG